MDAFLTIEAQQTLRAVKAISPRRNAAGLLIGHKRGGRFFIEKAFPGPQGFQPTPKTLAVLDAVFEGRIIGFFRVNPGEKDERALLQPFACGKFLLTIESRSSAESLLIGYLIDYDGRYVLEQIPIVPEKVLPQKKRVRP
jgi:hypothetical protein